MVGKVSDRSFIYCFFGQRCGLAVIFQEFCWTDRFPPWRNVLFALQCSWIQLLPYISSDEYGWYPICSPPLSPYCETVIILLLSFSLHFFCQEKNKTRENFCLGGGGASQFSHFSWGFSPFSLFPFPFFMLTFLLTSPFPVSCLKGGLAPPFSSTLLFLKIRMMTDCFLPSSFIYLSTPVFFHSGFLQVLAHIFSCSAFCFSFLLCDYRRSPGPPSPPFRAASPGLASSCPAPTEDFAAWLSSPCCCCGAGDALVPFHFSQHSGIRFER